MKDKILINKSMIPYRFDIQIGGEMFTLKIDYNATISLFTVTTYKSGKLLCANEPILYGQPLWGDCYTVEEFPCLTIIPLDESSSTDRVTWGNFGETVFLCIDDEPEVAENGG